MLDVVLLGVEVVAELDVEAHAALRPAVAAALPDREAIVWRGRRLRYGDLRERCLRLAGVLADHRLGRHRPRSALAPWEAGQDLVATYLLNEKRQNLHTIEARHVVRAPAGPGHEQ